MQYIYTIGIWILGFVYRLAALFMPKAKQWVQGRKNWQNQLSERVNAWPAEAKKVWIHCASLGEFEQGRPLIEKIKENQPDTLILLTFFSPSGYEVRKNFPFADGVQYLPLDTPRNARIFLETIQPDLAIFVKYEFWFNLIAYAKKKEVPIVLIAGLFRENQHFFRPFGKWFLQQLSTFKHFYLQNEISGQLLKSQGIEQWSVVGDPRVDRVLQIAEKAATFPEIALWQAQRPTLVVGSSWPPDEKLLFPFFAEALPKGWCVIIAPHDISAKHIQQIEEQLPLPFQRYSSLKENGLAEGTPVLIIDNIGMLSALYQYGKIAYIGGGFGTGIHNSLEPMAFQLPVIFGPKYQKFKEATHTVNSGGSFVVEDRKQLDTVFAQLLQATNYQNSSDQVYDYLLQSKEATNKIFVDLGKLGLL